MRFFFYGTLLDGSDNPVARSIHAKLAPEGPATALGALHAIPDPEGWFPAMLPGGGAIHGGLYRATGDFTEADLVRMDAYEDCDPDSPAAALYRRAEVLVLTADAKTVPAQAYLFNQPLPDGSRPVPDGDFRAWLVAEGLAQFGGTRASPGE
jgi:gamma-glutamylcyclotransferase (GGCT)/AIG2-like uncharacterized protein YtfP